MSHLQGWPLLDGIAKNMRVPNHVRHYVRQRIAEIKAAGRGPISPDGSALVIAGRLGFTGYVSEEGEGFIETDGLGDDSPPLRDDGPIGGIIALILGSRKYPVLREALPARTEHATTCTKCQRTGFTDVGQIRNFLLCPECYGLRWASPSLFRKHDSTPDRR